MRETIRRRISGLTDQTKLAISKQNTFYSVEIARQLFFTVHLNYSSNIIALEKVSAMFVSVSCNNRNVGIENPLSNSGQILGSCDS